MEKSTDHFDLAPDYIRSDEIGPSQVLYELRVARIPLAEELSDRELIDMVTKIREPLHRLVRVLNTFSESHPGAKKMVNILRKSSSRISRRLIPGDKKLGRTPKQRKKMRRLLERVKEMMKDLIQHLSHIGYARSLIALLSYIGECCEKRDDALTDIHLQAALRLQESLSSGMKHPGIAIRAKLDQTLARNRHLRPYDQDMLSPAEVKEVIADWTGQVSGLEPEEVHQKFQHEWEMSPHLVMRHPTLRLLYMDVLRDFTDLGLSWQIEMLNQLELCESTEDGSLLNDLLLIAHIALEQQRNIMAKGIFDYFFRKFQRHSEQDFRNLAPDRRANIITDLREFYTDLQDGDLTTTESGYDTRFEDEHTKRIENIDFGKINKQEKEEDEQEK